MSANDSEGQAPPSLIDAMMVPEFYPHHPDDIELRQTHISYVFLAGEYAYKIKKPVQLPFIDCSTLAKRLDFCQREVLLNRRLAPDTYLGVVPIKFSHGVFTSGENREDGEAAVEFAVKMRRLPDERRLDNLIAAREISTAEVQAVAKRLAEFHAAAARADAWRYGAAAAIWQLVIGNIGETERLLADTVSGDKLKIIESYVRHYISSHWRFLNMRARNGQVLDGHGDLRCEAVYLTKEGITIVDCVEFSDALRYCDAAAEVSFLAMDLDRLEQPEFSAEFIRSYIDASKDEDLPILLAFYKCHHAVVRAKVELIASRQDYRPVNERLACRERARHYLDQACVSAKQQTEGVLSHSLLPAAKRRVINRQLNH
jgi:aminoglycoside phosphotransferase family enzyme